MDREHPQPQGPLGISLPRAVTLLPMASGHCHSFRNDTDPSQPLFLDQPFPLCALPLPKASGPQAQRPVFVMGS